jgi:hypothetical protein
LLFATLLLSLTLDQANYSVLLTVLFGATGACVYGLLGDFSDVLFGFWGAASFILVPAFALLAWLLIRFTPRSSARLLAFQCLLFGLLYPCLAGLDTDRQSLYFNLAALSFLGFAAWQLASTSSRSWPAVQPSPAS